MSSKREREELMSDDWEETLLSPRKHASVEHPMADVASILKHRTSQSVTVLSDEDDEPPLLPRVHGDRTQSLQQEVAAFFDESENDETVSVPKKPTKSGKLQKTTRKLKQQASTSADRNDRSLLPPKQLRKTKLEPISLPCHSQLNAAPIADRDGTIQQCSQTQVSEANLDTIDARKPLDKRCMVNPPTLESTQVITVDAQATVQPSPTSAVPQSPARVTIASLTPHKIAAKVDGRVSSKTPLKQRSRDNKSLTVFSFVVHDDTGDITVNAWDDVATGIYETVKVGRCFSLTMCKVKEVNIANQQYNATNHPNELTLTKWSKVIELPDDSLPPLKSNLLSIDELEGKQTNDVVDLIAIVFEIGPVMLINCQDGKTRRKRNVVLVDESGKMVSLGLWPEFTDQLNDREGEAVMFQNLQVRDYRNNLVLSSTTNTIISVNSPNDTVQNLQKWFAEEGCQHEYEELTYNPKKNVGSEE